MQSLEQYIDTIKRGKGGMTFIDRSNDGHIFELREVKYSGGDFH